MRKSQPAGEKARRPVGSIRDVRQALLVELEEHRLVEEGRAVEVMKFVELVAMELVERVELVAFEIVEFVELAAMKLAAEALEVAFPEAAFSEVAVAGLGGTGGERHRGEEAQGGNQPSEARG